MVILEFPTFDEAKAWYDSPAYRKVREHRYKGADYRAIIVMRGIPWAATKAAGSTGELAGFR